MPAANYPVESIGSVLVLPVPISFETGEAGTIKLPLMPFRYKVTDVDTVVQKALAATNAGTLVLKEGSTTLATVTIDASAAIGDEDSAPSIASHAIGLDEQLTLVTAKGNAGGKAMAFLTLEVLPSH